MRQKNVQTVLRIEGMTCTGCETRIENVLRKLEGIVEVKAIYSSSNVYVTYDSIVLELEAIIKAIEKLDYTVANKPSENKDTADEGDEGSTDNNVTKKVKIGQLIGIGVIILALYLVINNTIGFNFIPEINQSMGYGILFVVGLLTSLHCIAMCGGINLSVCMQYKTDDTGSKFDKLKPSALYNLGRVISYTIVGGMVGALGSIVSFSGTAKGIIAVISGAFMVIMGLNMLNIFPWLRKLNPRLPKFLGRKVHSNAGRKGPLFVGLLNGLMPCGPLQAMQLYALGTGSFVAGALSMFIFSLGTVPLMFGFGAVSSLISGKFTHKMMKVSAVLVMVLGVIMLNRGLNLSGLGIITASATENESIAKVKDGIQYVSTEIDSGSYSPIIVQKGIPVKWTIKVEKGDLNGCNNPITIPKYNKQVKLKLGDNVIEFTPDDTGDIVYTCWMGMISSRIKVVEDVSNVSDEEIADINDSSSQAVSGGSCCSAGSKATKFAGGNIPTDEIAIAKIENGIQTVSFNVNDYGFSPAVIVMQKGIQTNFIINGEQLNYCNNSLIFPEYNAKIDLEEGENKIEFIPEGNFSFRCWMGMLNGYVKVVDDIEKIDINTIKEEVELFKPTGGGGGCCG